jgi:hypothetical protein
MEDGIGFGTPHAMVQAGEHEMVAEWANVVHTLRSAL